MLFLYRWKLIRKHSQHKTQCTTKWLNINDNAIIFDRFDELLSLLFEMEIDPRTKHIITKECVIQCIISDDNYSFSEYIETAKGEKESFSQYLLSVTNM
jgi:hypothetical protein